MLHKDEGIRVPGRQVAAVRKAGVLIAALASTGNGPKRTALGSLAYPNPAPSYMYSMD